MTEVRKSLTEKNRIVLKIGSSSLTHPATGELNLWKIERLVRIICDLKGEGKEVVLRRHSGRPPGPGRAETPGHHIGKTGVCGSGTGPADDGVPETVFRV